MIAIIVLLSVIAVLGGVSAPTDPAAAPAEMSGMLMLIVVLARAVIWPSLAGQAKRWHDVDMSAWWILIGRVPAVGGLIALVFNGFIGGTPGPNRSGRACGVNVRGVKHLNVWVKPAGRLDPVQPSAIEYAASFLRSSTFFVRTYAGRPSRA